MTRRKAAALLSLLAVIAAATLIFFFSSQEGQESSRLSGRVTRFVLSVVMPGFNDLSTAEQLAEVQRWGLAIRKLAHFSEYALLGALLVNYLRFPEHGKKVRVLTLIAWAVAAVYACTDEAHQLFVSQRAGAVTDVLIDAAGAFTGALLASIILKLYRRKRAGEA